MVDERANPIRRWWWLIIVGLILGAGVGYVLGQQMGKLESSSALLVLGAGGVAPTGDSALESNQYVNARMPTYAAVASTDSVTQRATAQLGLPADALTGTIAAVAVPDTTLVELTVTGPTPQAAQDRAAAVTAALQAAIEESENLVGQPPRVQLSVVSAASLPEAPLLPGRVILIIGAVLGLVIGIIAMVIVGRQERTSQQRRSAYDVSQAGRTSAIQLPNGRPLPPRAPRRSGSASGDIVGQSGRERQ